MKKMKLFLLAGAMVAGMFATVGAQAHCGSGTAADKGNNAHDPFGSCEYDGDVHCAQDATDATLFTLDTTASGGAGAQVCNDGSTLPAPVGRAGVYRADSGKITAHVDGDKDQPGSQGMTRVDIDPNAAACKVKIRRGNTGSYWTQGGAMQDTAVLDQCAG